MRHNKDAKKFSRSSAHRDALWRNMATSLLREGKIRTTLAKAKELRRVTDRLVTLAKRAAAYREGDEKQIAAHRLHLRRQAIGFLHDNAVVAKLFGEIAEQYADRNGGYTRVLKLGQRLGDGAKTAIVELVQEETPEKGKKKRGKKPGVKKAAAKKSAKPDAKAPAKKTRAAKPAAPPTEMAAAAEEPKKEE
jgi:large subunit ribosomal protein L17